ncbi:leucine-rich repeat-containing protein 63-like [Ylistrum balloti]|uniref:leucine-rich repeat-containing protein 63-like n=1 Tax=Ylistrum balloti TaxID=509963 RepID=UPI0029059C7F|nr:leucine-rich repeat-containing protein 63-like [Ylistrum balloti]
MAASGPSLVFTTNSSKHKKNSSTQDTKLLRRPRAPKPLPPLSTPSPTKNSSSPVKPFYETYDFDTDIPTRETPVTIRQSPTPSVVPSLISPPPSESNPTRKHYLYRHVIQHGSQQTNVAFVSRDDKKFILDPLYRVKTSLGTYVDGKSLIKPFKPRGPESFPARPPRRHPEIFHVDYVDDIRYYAPPTFTLETFMMEISDRQRLPMRSVKQAVCSRYNYKKMTKLLAEQNTFELSQDEVHTNTFTPEGQSIPPVEPRIPQKQLLIEMAAMIKQHVRDLMNTEVKSVIRPLKRYSPSHHDTDVPHTEIILYEDDTTEVASRSQQIRQDTEIPSVDSMFHSARSRYFQGSGRSQSPFTAPGDANGVISPSELAILDSLINGGRALSLKAHFISELPDINPLIRTVTYINLSFNDFTLFPRSILDVKQLVTLKLRNNPLRELPPDIQRLKNLKTLVVSFCLLQTLPLGLFSLQKLRHLDISYNKITFVPNEISQFRSLRELNMEGNQLPAMPCGALLLELNYLNVKNNFMHPLFWKENTRNQPQRLIDMAALTMYKSEMYRKAENLAPSVINVLSSRSTCDCCHGPLYGPGLRIIRPVSKLHGIINLPFIFRACSPHCLRDFKSSKETLSEILYGAREGHTDEEEEEEEEEEEGE